MTEAVVLQILQVLVAAFPPLADLLQKYLPSGDEEPLAARVRAILPERGESAKVREALESGKALDDEEDDDT
jgi:hypothetical protein